MPHRLLTSAAVDTGQPDADLTFGILTRDSASYSSLTYSTMPDRRSFRALLGLCVLLALVTLADFRRLRSGEKYLLLFFFSLARRFAVNATKQCRKSVGELIL
jgi:hypothetical protein